MIQPDYVAQDSAKSVIYIRCRGGCGEMKQVEVGTIALEAYQGGVIAQRAFPEMGVDQRELLISGTCGECFDKLFPPDEGGEG